MLDSGSTGNYVSDEVAHLFNLIIQAKEGSDQLTLTDGSKVQAQGYFSFRLRCGQYNSEVLTWVFPDMHQKLILGIPWLKQENPRIDWRQGQVNIIKNEEIIFLPSHRQECENNDEVQCLTSNVYGQGISCQGVKMPHPCARTGVPRSMGDNPRVRSCEGQIECNAGM